MKTRILIAAALAVCLTSCWLETEKQKEFAAARDAIIPSLLAPSTAKFCPFKEATFSDKDGAHVVELWVDAQNGFGVPIRRHMGVTIDPKSGQVKKIACHEDEAEERRRKQEEKLAALNRLGDEIKESNLEFQIRLQSGRMSSYEIELERIKTAGYQLRLRTLSH